MGPFRGRGRGRHAGGRDERDAGSGAPPPPDGTKNGGGWCSAPGGATGVHLYTVTTTCSLIKTSLK